MLNSMSVEQSSSKTTLSQGEGSPHKPKQTPDLCQFGILSSFHSTFCVLL